MLETIKKWGCFALFIVPLSLYRSVKFEMGLAIDGEQRELWELFDELKAREDA